MIFFNNSGNFWSDPGDRELTLESRGLLEDLEGLELLQHLGVCNTNSFVGILLELFYPLTISFSQG